CRNGRAHSLDGRSGQHDLLARCLSLQNPLQRRYQILHGRQQKDSALATRLLECARRCDISLRLAFQLVLHWAGSHVQGVLPREHPSHLRLDQSRLHLFSYYSKPIHVALTSVYASSASGPISRPHPEARSPPQGAAGSRPETVFTRTAPAEIREARLCPLARFSVQTEADKP